MPRAIDFWLLMNYISLMENNGGGRAAKKFSAPEVAGRSEGEPTFCKKIPDKEIRNYWLAHWRQAR
jgi:hypothetical protein